MPKRHNWILLIALAAMLSVGFVLPARATAMPATSAAVAQWSVLELSFTSHTSYSNAYLGGIDLTVTFSGPAGLQQVVPGFWAGGSQFNVRFAPSAQGSWTYRTHSSLDSSLTSLAGSFSVGAPLPGNHGFVRVDTANPYTFVWDEKQNGAPLGFFMLGQTYYEIVRNAAGQGNWRQAVDQSAAYGIDKIRLLIYPWPGDAADNAYPDTQPFAGSSTQPNHDQLNLAHWQLLDTIISYLESKQMVADVILFADSDRIYGTQSQNDRYVRYALARLSAYHNVTWTISNEWNYGDPDKDGQPGTAHDKTLFSGWGALVAATDPYFLAGGYRRPLSIHQQTRADFQFFGSSWAEPATLQYGLRSGKSTGDAWGAAAIRDNWGHNMPVVLDEFGYLGETSGSVVINRTAVRQTLWTVAVSGGYASLGDAIGTSTGKPWLTGDWRYDATYLDVKRFKDFWTGRGLDFGALSPQNAVVRSGTRVYAAGAADREYVVYAAQGGSLSLSLPAGTYDITRFNPDAGCASACEVALAPQTGSVLSFTSASLPAGTDWVLYLRPSSPAPTRTASPTVTRTARPTATHTASPDASPTPTASPASDPKSTSYPGPAPKAYQYDLWVPVIES